MRVNNKRESQTAMAKMIIGESTPIRIGLIIAFLSIFGSAVWWASSVNSKLDSILSFQSSVNSTIVELKAQDLAINKELGDIKLHLALTDVSIKTIQDKHPSEIKPN